jgi:hypothetical protein
MPSAAKRKARGGQREEMNVTSKKGNERGKGAKMRAETRSPAEAVEKVDTSTAARAARAAAAVRARARSSPVPPEARTRDVPRAAAKETGAAEVLRELREIKGMVGSLLAPPASGDGDVEASLDSLRRLLSTLIEERTEAILGDLVRLRQDAAGLQVQGEFVERLDAVLERLGAVPFVAEDMEYVDPLIHLAVEERSTGGAPPGVIVATVRPGYRTARGRVLCKAAVAVSREG